MKRLFGAARRPSLLARYLLIIVSALVVLPAALLMAGTGSVVISGLVSPKERDNPYADTSRLIEEWHREAALLRHADPETIVRSLESWRSRYPRSSVFWVDSASRLRASLPFDEDLPQIWSSVYTVDFMKEAVNGTKYSVVAFIGKDGEQGFMAMQVPRYLTLPNGQRLGMLGGTAYTAGAIVLLGLFLTVSFLFFNRIRKRLVRLQAAMEQPSGSGLPLPVEVSGADEVGRLEESFNGMVRELEAGRRREAEEESLRRELVARLSHDLRTPLTVVRSHAYSLEREPLSGQGRKSVKLIGVKLDYLSQLIENLFSYSLLSAGKYAYRPEKTDIVRLARTQLAAWYPAFEQAGMELEPDLPDAPVYWHTDPHWLERVLDNLLQNALRHAASGGWTAVRIVEDEGGGLIIEDKGPGLGGDSPNKGSGLGLSIVQLMLKEMGLRKEVSSGEGGTAVAVKPEQMDG
ncbi:MULTISPECIES: HAMP domain-containing sensor histidine kinase [unclassified Paenibacillus]|uniref:sensor histidine kinase n=1 Tax=unclassified Paenibacillus TaxID=185978 RepID=UPI000955A049|nr:MULTISPECIES: HAMP domain-containing sensor histidine kinase [unclassified Paenibacillus]ASS68000.1 HAMP domain-containing histidine kinase [Paenibacillus sp. RUD330]SIR41843.1 Signal transduction histidine kinase [Paenibacillus sp. RU4X]SIR51922.1 Signal transduction histidine kinase [Paenibacillus sp. RU4T]